MAGRLIGRLTGTGRVDYGAPAAGDDAGQEAERKPWHEKMLRLLEVEVTTPRPGELVVYDGKGEERFRSPCSGTYEGGVGRFTSHLAPERDIDHASFCMVLDEGGMGLAWWNDMGCLAAGEPIVLGIRID